VVLSGAGVMPGQFVFADSSGAVIIPGGQLEDVITGARAVEAEDERYRSGIRQERLPGSSKDAGDRS
jgi:4-hydroxy-4-methyl-2-oxoglutarate aldolase